MVVAGVPAKEIHKRFSDDICEKLTDLKWWDWPEDKLQKYGKYFESPEALLEAVKEDK